MIKKIRKLWNTGKYSTANELIDAIQEEYGIDLHTDKIFIDNVTNNIIQGGDGKYWKK